MSKLNIDYTNYSFFELYGLADLIISFCESKMKLDDFNLIIENLDKITEDEIIKYYEEYKKTLLGDFYTVYKEDNKFEYKNLKDKPDIKKGEYLSSHVITTDKEKIQLHEILSKEIKDLETNKKVSPFFTKINSNHKKQYNNFYNSLHKISSLISVTTKNKFSFYDNNGYNSFIPDFKNIEGYIF